MSPKWVSRVAQMVANNIEPRMIIDDTIIHFPGIEEADIVLAMTEIETFNKKISKVEIARKARMSGVSSPFNKSTFMRS